MGGILGGGGGGTSVTQVNIPGPTPEEMELTRTQVELQKEQLSILKEQRVEQATAFEFLTDELNRLNEAAVTEDPVFQEIQQLELERIRRGGAASPKEIELIEEATARAEELGTGQIQQFQEQSLGQLRDILAPARGLRPSDRPIVARGEEIVREGQRQQGQLVTGLAQTRATAELNFPLAREQVLSQIGQFQQQLSESARNFQQQLQQTAFENRLRLAGFGQQGSLGLLGVQPSGLGALAALSSARVAGASTTTTKSGGGSGIGGFLGGLGSAASGGAALFTAFSSKAMKENRQTVNIPEMERLLDTLVIEKWSYKPEHELGTDMHIGPYAEDFQNLFGVGDGKTLALVDVMGVLLASMKGLLAKVTRLEKEIANA